MDYTVQYAVSPSIRPEKIHKSEWLHRYIVNKRGKNDTMGAKSARVFFGITE